MTRLSKCKKCNGEVEILAKVCPHCTQRDPTITARSIIIVLILTAGVAVPLAYFFDSSNDEKQPKLTAKPFQSTVSWSIDRDEAKGLIVTGKTNLPEGTEFVVSLGIKNGKSLGQSKATVGDNGIFRAGPFSNNNHLHQPVVYEVSASMRIAIPKPKDVPTAEHLMIGPYIKSCPPPAAVCLDYTGELTIE